MMPIHWRDSIMTWPTLSLEIYLPPWHWRLVPYFYYDHTPGIKAGRWQDAHAGWWGFNVRWLMVQLVFGFNLPPFALEKKANPDSHEWLGSDR